MGFKEIGKKIQKAREEKGLTQVDLAQTLGITQAALSNYELGKRRLYLHQIEEFARLLEKNLDYFIGPHDDASNARPSESSSRKEQIMARIRDLDLSEEELGEMSEYLDFLTWRKNHD
ncbi:MAG: helix-turn-helix transcriptional regulator [Desulfomonilia bacterium]|jgi:transcriptional regulator with XRE-family HTH domain